MSRALFVAVFEREEDIRAAVLEFRRKNYRIQDVYTPYPVHGLDEAMGLPPSRIGWACFLFGAPACVAAVAFQSWVAAIDWPINIGGKPFFFWQMFIPVAFEFTVLCAGLGTVATLLVSQRLFPWAKPRLPALGATDDRFVLALAMTDTAFDREEVLSLCRRHRALRTHEHLEGEG